MKMKWLAILGACVVGSAPHSWAGMEDRPLVMSPVDFQVALQQDEGFSPELAQAGSVGECLRRLAQANLVSGSFPTARVLGVPVLRTQGLPAGEASFRAEHPSSGERYYGWMKVRVFHRTAVDDRTGEVLGLLIECGREPTATWIQGPSYVLRFADGDRGVIDSR